MALYTPLSPEQLSQVAGRYGLSLDRSVPEPKGSINTNYHLWAGGERYFLRLNEGKTDAEVAFEASVLRYLEEARFPAVRLVRSTEGASHVEVAGRQAMLFAYAPGEELRREDVGEAECRRMGEQFGRLHELASGFEADRPNPYALARVAGWLAELGTDGDGDPEVAAALPMLRDELSRAAALPSAPRGLVHGDLFLDNVHWIGGRVSAVLDWEMSCVDAFAYDLGVAVNAWCYDARFRPELCRALLQGYRAKRPLDDATRDALYPFARYAALRYTASRIHAFHRAGLGADRLAWKDWRRYRDRLAALRDMGEAGFRDFAGL
ncbi:homoserine kinase [Anaeromyxobacter paludicola]|uniref:Homoserine kinase n=1 Tax=Anaeromyxobacter paludicola TaxID=2918171 RepID=A0ABM7XA17_9BACT|nr:homoserine kinase [Anaeromyxobacter paludicola]BDG08697.1 homoserine kinase [Anaeromyxobacter paludicola]